MKKTLVAALITVALFACQKGLDDDPKPIIHYGTVIFYTSNPEADKEWEVYIDGSSNSAGLVPYTAIEPSCGNSGLGLQVSLKEGTHRVLLKSLEGFPSRSEDITVGDGCQTFK
jgi:hypothetical protein